MEKEKTNGQERICGFLCVAEEMDRVKMHMLERKKMSKNANNYPTTKKL